jgi:hypothetical protein
MGSVRISLIGVRGAHLTQRRANRPALRRTWRTDMCKSAAATHTSRTLRRGHTVVKRSSQLRRNTGSRRKML